MTRKYLKPLALFMALNLLGEICFPTICYALTGGPSQPEMESFEPVGTTDMVDLFTGDFTYNIPLFDVGGYPLNIAYHSGIGMDQEASWTGLGWNINAGVINRAMRGLPDDFKGDEISYETKIKDNVTWGLNAGAEFELLGLTKKQKDKSQARADARAKADSSSDNSVQMGEGFTTIGVNMGITQNNYRGLGVFFGASFRIPNTSVPIGVNTSSQGGFEYDVSFSTKVKKKKVGMNIGIGSRTGLKMSVIGPKFEKEWATKNKRLKTSGAINLSTTIPLSPMADLPTLNNSFKTSVQNYNITVGTSFWGTHQNFRLGGTYSSTNIIDARRSRKAYGYMYAEGISQNSDGVQDFSRERDGTFGPDTKNLPLVSSSFDFLSVSGQGTGGMFRAHRRNLGIYYDPTNTTRTSNWGTAGVELGFLPASFHAGVDYTPTGAAEYSGVWDRENGNELHYYSFDNTRATWNGTQFIVEERPFDENYYFQAGGEKVVSDIGYYNSLMGETAARLQMKGEGLSYHASIKPYLEGDNQGGGFISEYDPLDARQPRAQHIGMITAKDAHEGAGMMPTLRSYIPGVFSQNSSAYTNISRPVSNKGHHIGEITQSNPDGSRYVYAIPAYNNEQHEVTFNTKDNGIDLARGLVNYVPGQDNSMANTRGVDYFYSREIKPGYAHSYLLTAVLSPNYVDIDGTVGPSKGDIGDYVIFNYTRHDAQYKWRVPAEENKAQYQEGLHSDAWDDKGHYVYGTKEIWFLHSIESRTHVALFKTSPRMDALGVKGENGGKDNDETTLKLDTIVLYSLPDRLQNGDDATPVKKVVFEYDYSLCKNVPNNINHNTSAAADTKGKLTLKKLYFLYGHSGKGAMSPYTFNYGYNPDYNMAEYDRWGNYKPNREVLPNRDFPYVDQNMPKDSADLYAQAWNMDRVNLPSGGSIRINYESDDYAFVQDRKAMQMMKVVGACESVGSVNSFSRGVPGYDKLYESKGDRRFEYLVFEVPQGINNAAELRDKCFQSIDKLYYKFLVQIRDKQEYISGWCDIERSEIGFAANPAYAYVKIKPTKQGDRMFNIHDHVNPISKAAWQFATAYLSKVLHPGSDPATTGVSAFQGLLDSWAEGLDMFRGQYQSLKVNHVASKFVPEKSWIRIETGSMFKYGGGCRVKEISFSDSWAHMDKLDKTGNYTQVYDYTKNDERYGLISSGVAAYEPMIGGEENPLRQLAEIYKKQTNIAMPAIEMFVEEPFGESFYPPAGVGYSKVTVRNKPKEGVNRTGTGYSVNQFYTAREYPVKVSRTGLKTASLGTGFGGQLLSSLLKVVTRDYYAASQGYSIVVNDMHGKPRSTGVYSELTNASGAALVISEVTYEYQDNNMVKVLNRDGTISDAMMGKEIDIAMDLRQNEQVSWNGGLNVNAKFDIVVPVAPVVWAIPLPKFSHSLSRRQSACVTKLVQTYGILKKTTVKDEGSLIATTNLLYDGLSGNVLLTQTSNMFEDPVYSFTYPAHFAYEDMGPSYLNYGVTDTIDFPLFVSGGLSGSVHQPGTFKKGDMLWAQDMTNAYIGYKFWVSEVVPVSGGEKIKLIDFGGRYVNPSTYIARVINPARKNFLNTNVGNVVSIKNPVVSNSISFATDKVVQASAQTFSDYNSLRPLFREIDSTLEYCHYYVYASMNPFSNGYGVWLPYQQKAFIEDRDYFFGKDSTFIRKDGVYKNFTPYWGFQSNNYMSQSTDKRWVNASTITKINMRAQPVEALDALGNSSAELYGYGDNFVTASSSYARLTDIGSDNFEDYTDIYGCTNIGTQYHWSFFIGMNDSLGILKPDLDNDGVTASLPVITKRHAHTGTQSILIPPGYKREVTNFTDTIAIIKYPAPYPTGYYEDLNTKTMRMPFSPEKGKKYMISAWVKGRGDYTNLNSYDSCYLRIRAFRVHTTLMDTIIKTSGPIIEGWQRVEGSFTVPDSSYHITVGIENTSRYKAYVDDIRVHPEESNMKTFVYDPTLLKVMAILDENNFATFYEYDREGKLIRIKKETINGIVTIQESRNGIQKVLNP